MARKIETPFSSASQPAVYVIEAGGSVKVGISRNPALRARGIQVSQDREVRVFWAVRLAKDDARKIEAAAHRELKAISGHLRGEWFAVSPETAVGAILRLLKKHGVQAEEDLTFGYQRTAGGGQ